MTSIIWLAVIIMTIEAMVSGSGLALIVGLILATIGMIFEASKT